MRVIFFNLFIYDREREAETQEEGEAGSMPGAQRGTRSRDSRIAPWAKDRCQTAEPPRDPHFQFYSITKHATLNIVIHISQCTCARL